MASRPLGPDSARSNVIPFCPIPQRTPAFNPADPKHVNLWEAAWGMVTLERDRMARERIEQQIDAQIAMLDVIDGDPDLEDGDVDCCPAFEDYGGAPVIGQIMPCGPGDPEDAEED